MGINKYQQTVNLKSSKRKYLFILSILAYMLNSELLACGYYLEPVCTSTPSCQTALGLSPGTNGYCVLTNMSNWTKYPISSPSFKNDDTVVNNLDMNSADLLYAGQPQPSLVINAHSGLQDGQYLYVVRSTDGKLIMRHVDRSYAVKSSNLSVRFNYTRFHNPNNYRTTGSNVGAVCSDPSPLLPPGVICSYLPVRHTQLNGTKPAVNGSYQNSDAWSPVYCAGEIRVHNGKIDRINNKSVQFTPDAACITNTITLLKALDITIDDNVKSGDYKTVKTYELFNCANDVNTVVPDVSDGSYHACSYTIIPGPQVPGLMETVVRQGSNTCGCTVLNTYWVWSHSYGCNGQIYSNGAEY